LKLGEKIQMNIADEKLEQAKKLIDLAIELRDMQKSLED